MNIATHIIIVFVFKNALVLIKSHLHLIEPSSSHKPSSHCWTNWYVFLCFVRAVLCFVRTALQSYLNSLISFEWMRHWLSNTRSLNCLQEITVIFYLMCGGMTSLIAVARSYKTPRFYQRSINFFFSSIIWSVASMTMICEFITRFASFKRKLIDRSMLSDFNFNFPSAIIGFFLFHSCFFIVLREEKKERDSEWEFEPTFIS